MFEVQAVEPVVPARARLHDSVACAGCGEQVMETRARIFRGESFCTPCFDARDRRY
ncbi:MAG TPA: TraR/DksA C4-type zinc finger protein [Anaerolineae bacterium]|nr:TraR/DksA C4-type zinc finger protein [Anaerolineae bacterium]